LALSSLLVAGLLLSALAGEQGVEYFISPVETEVATDLDQSRPVQADLRVEKPRALADAMNLGADAVTSTDSVRVPLGAHPVGTDPPDQADRQASFIIDFDEPSVQRMIQELRETHGENPGVPELVSFVNLALKEKNYQHGMDIASRVATNRAGDCSEHALLLAALARASGYPARVILGTVIVSDGGDVASYWHAWNEIHTGSQWTLADATSIGEAERLYYIRSAPIENEGMSFRLGMVTILKDLGVARVSLSNR
jgi:hypothetical protein